MVLFLRTKGNPAFAEYSGHKLRTKVFHSDTRLLIKHPNTDMRAPRELSTLGLQKIGIVQILDNTVPYFLRLDYHPIKTIGRNS